MSPARQAHSSKPAAAGLPLWAHAGTDGRTDTTLLHRPCSPYCAGNNANNNELFVKLPDFEYNIVR